MRTKRFHGLKRLKIRQTWNKYNLYNLSRLRRPYVTPLTYFQQKWSAKSATRAYHGEQLREGQWERMFTSKIRSVIPMDHRYLATHDGSEQAQGRGSGRDQIHPRNTKEAIPYMQMAYAPIERRLDTAIFRALFASSTRQARQFVIHGAVKVNGKKMIHPSYLLNPGDMFQVDPERVLFATGAPKSRQESRVGRRIRSRARRAQEETTVGGVEETPVGEVPDTAASLTRTPKVDKEPSTKPEEALAKRRKESKNNLKELIENAKSILEDRKDETSAKRKQALRAFTRSVRAAMREVNRKTVDALENTDSALNYELSDILSQLSISSKDANQEVPNKESQSSQPLSKEQSKLLREALKEAHNNPIDNSKPYATPWRPRPYMSAFAFIPRYLEVNQNICSAVYLRHPVTRPGLAEVPTPFAQESSQLAFNWYLRRR